MTQEALFDASPKPHGYVKPIAGGKWEASCGMCRWKGRDNYASKIFARIGIGAHLRHAHGVGANERRIEEQK